MLGHVFFDKTMFTLCEGQMLKRSVISRAYTRAKIRHLNDDSSEK